jgi:hypothetical protein
VVSSMNSTRTWVTPPREPVRPRTPVEVSIGWEQGGRADG